MEKILNAICWFDTEIEPNSGPRFYMDSGDTPGHPPDIGHFKGDGRVKGRQGTPHIKSIVVTFVPWC